MSQIQNAHGESEITAIIIDLPSKLLSGSSDGTIKIWDINTTACHRILQPGRDGPVDILQVGRTHVYCLQMYYLQVYRYTGHRCAGVQV